MINHFSEFSYLGKIVMNGLGNSYKIVWSPINYYRDNVIEFVSISTAVMGNHRC